MTDRSETHVSVLAPRFRIDDRDGGCRELKRLRLGVRSSERGRGFVRRGRGPGGVGCGAVLRRCRS